MMAGIAVSGVKAVLATTTKEFYMADYSEDYLLDKKIKIFQPQNGYRASTDAVLLAASLHKVRSGDNILDVGSGTGAVSLCAAERFRAENPDITGLEIQPQLAELANMSAAANGFEQLKYLNCDISACPLQPCSFAHVITNPPYAEKDMPSPNASKATAHNLNGFDLRGWINFCLKMTKPQGYFYIINRAAALEDILAAIHGKLGAAEVFPLYSKAGQPAKRVIVRAKKDSRAPLVIHPGLTIHQENGGYGKEAEQILRQGSRLPE